MLPTSLCVFEEDIFIIHSPYHIIQYYQAYYAFGDLKVNVLFSLLLLTFMFHQINNITKYSSY